MAAPRPIVGWREWVRLPGLDPSSTPTKAKVDTGARTSALHAFDLRVVERGAVSLVHFELHPTQRSDEPSTAASATVQEWREVRSSSGQVELRPVIRTPVELGGHRFDIELTLTSRDEMGFRLLLGRSAVRSRFLVHPGRSWLLSENLDPGASDADEDDVGDAARSG